MGHGSVASQHRHFQSTGQPFSASKLRKTMTKIAGTSGYFLALSLVPPTIATMQKLILTIAVLAASILGSQAKEYTVTKSDPIAKITFPAEWKVTEEEEIINATSEDESISLDVEIFEKDNLDEALKSTIDYLKENKVTIDEKSLKESEGKINGLEATFLSYDGKDEEGPCVVSLCFMILTEEKMVSILHWSPAKVDEEQQKQVLAILNSVKKK